MEGRGPARGSRVVVVGCVEVSSVAEAVLREAMSEHWARVVASGWRVASPSARLELVPAPPPESGLSAESLAHELQTRVDSSEVGAREVLEIVRDLIREAPVAGDETECLTRIKLLEQVKAAAAAAQARLTERFVQARAGREEAAGMALDRRARGIGSEVGLARGESPQAGSRAVRAAHTLCGQMPHALAALKAGQLSEFAASLVVKEVAALDPQACTVIDEAMKDHYATLGIRALTGRVRALVNQADPAGQVERRHVAVSQRRVSVRPAPGSMAYLTALVPLEQAVACKKSLRDAANEEACSREVVTRSSTQAEADILVERVTGQATATAVPVEIQLLMSDTALLGIPRAHFAAGTTGTATNLEGAAHEVAQSSVHASAWIPGVGPLPAAIARDLLDPRHDTGDPLNRQRVFLRRVLLDPLTGDVTAMDTRRRAFTGTLRKALILRDDHCRTPWCNAPIAHLDHTHPYALGGRTNAANATGLCARCNYTKELPGWSHSKQPSANGLTVTTPTGHHYRSLPPPQPGSHQLNWSGEK